MATVAATGGVWASVRGINVIKPAKEAFKVGHKTGLALGAKSVGKTTFVASGSMHAPDIIGSAKADCPDVVFIQFDANGVSGALNAGLNPGVIDLSHCGDWDQMKIGLAQAIHHLKPLCASGEVRIVGIDLGAIDNAIRAWTAGIKLGDLAAGKLDKDPAVALASRDKDLNWTAAGAQGLMVYSALSQLQCLVIGMAHLQLTNNNPMRDKESAEMKLAREIKSIGGESSKLKANLFGGFEKPWMTNSDFTIARELKDGKFYSHIEGNEMFEAGNRFRNILKPTEPGERSLNSLLKQVEAKIL